jgi:hypothetical protein
MSEMTTKPIAHEEAIKMQAVELYLMNELSEEEQLGFEAHYFECPTCADAVAAGQAFVTDIRPVVPPPVPLWRHPAAAIATLLFAIAATQQFVIARFMAPHANTVILARQRERGAEQKPYALNTPSATVELSLPPEAEFPFYRVKISGGQKRNLSQAVPAPEKDSERRLSVQLARGALGSGHFDVRVEGLSNEDSPDGRVVDEVYEFDLK